MAKGIKCDDDGEKSSGESRNNHGEKSGGSRNNQRDGENSSGDSRKNYGGDNSSGGSRNNHGKKSSGESCNNQRDGETSSGGSRNNHGKKSSGESRNNKRDCEKSSEGSRNNHDKTTKIKESIVDEIEDDQSVRTKSIRLIRHEAEMNEFTETFDTTENNTCDIEMKVEDFHHSDSPLSIGAMKTNILKTVASQYLLLIHMLSIIMYHLSYVLYRLSTLGYFIFKGPNKKIIYQNCIQETIRNFIQNFFERISTDKLSNISMKRFQHILKWPDQTFPSIYQVYPAHTLGEYYREIESNPQMSFQERMQYDMLRTSTFSEFPRDCPVSTLTLAKAGFYYEGEADEVTCFKCGKKYRNWKHLDDPIQIHRTISPSCTFISELIKDISGGTSSNQAYSRNEDNVIYRRENDHSNNFTRCERGNIVEGEQANIAMSSNEGVSYNEGLSEKTSKESGHNNENSNNSSNTYTSVPRAGDAMGSRCISGIQTSRNTNEGYSDTSGIQTSRNMNEGYSDTSGIQTSRNMNEGYSDTSGIQTSRNTNEKYSDTSIPRVPDEYIANPQSSRDRHQNETSSTIFVNSNTPHISSSDDGISQNSLSQQTTISTIPPTSSTISTPVNNDQTQSAASTLEPLGISIEKPKYPQYAVLATRISSFRNWPEHLKQKPEELARAGFLYEGKSDFTRCFFCAGGLRDWEPHDDPWIEHARWYKKCVFLRQCMGEDFVNLVRQNKIQEARDKLDGRINDTATVQQTENILTSTAAQSVLEMGYSREKILNAFQIIKRNKDIRRITADSLLQCILEIEEEHTACLTSEETIKHEKGYPEFPTAASQENVNVESKESTDALLTENRQLREQQICKICMDEDISIVFLPCGHMVTCVNCAPAVRKCPLCRRFIKGTVKALMS